MADVATWVANPTRALATGGYYRFGVVIPATMSEDDTLTALTQRGWLTKSAGTPPPDMAQALANLTAVGLATPHAWWIHATWTKAPTILPTHDGPIYYGPLDIWTTVPEQPPEPPQEPSTFPSVIGFAAGALMTLAVLWRLRTRRFP